MNNSLEVLLPTKPTPPDLKPLWGVATQADPLRVKLDGPGEELPVTPKALVDGLLDGDRVWCSLHKGELVVHGFLPAERLDLTFTGSEMDPAAYRRASRVSLTGGWSGVSGVLFTLPPGWRPSTTQTFGAVTVNANGQVSVTATSGNFLISGAKYPQGA